MILSLFSYLRNGLAELQDEYDIAIIDCPPTFGVSVKNALFASDYYIIPAKLDYLSMLGIDNLEDNIEKFRQDCDKYIDFLDSSRYERMSLSVLGIVPMMVNITKGDTPITSQQEYMQAMKEHYYLFHYVRNNGSVFGATPKDGVPAVLTHPKFNFVKELKNLGDEFLRKIEA